MFIQVTPPVSIMLANVFRLSPFQRNIMLSIWDGEKERERDWDYEACT